MTVPTQKLYPKKANTFGNSIMEPLLRSNATPITFMDSTIWAPAKIVNILHLNMMRAVPETFLLSIDVQ